MKTPIEISLEKPKGIAILIDPDKFLKNKLRNSFLNKLNVLEPDFIFIGGSIVSEIDFNQCIRHVRSRTKIPIVIFPGDYHQISEEADGILLLSLLSGKNYEYIFGQHIKAAETLENTNIEILPTAYLLIEGGTLSAVQRVTQSEPIKSNNVDLSKKITLAAKHLGMKMVYLDAGSGAKKTVNNEMIKKVAKCGLPLIVGGGIRDIKTIKNIHDSGARIAVIGNHLETNPEFIEQLIAYRKTKSQLKLLSSNQDF